MPNRFPPDIGHLFLSLLLVSAGCEGRSTPKPPSTSVTPAASESALPDVAEAGLARVIAHTAGAIARSGAVHIELNAPLGAPSNRPAPATLIRVEPAVEGGAEWVSGTRLVFTPSGGWQPGVRYAVTVDAQGLEPARFEVWALPQSFEVRWTGVVSLVSGERRFRGEITTRDAAEAAAVEPMLTAAIAKAPLSVSWTHSDDQQRHRFEVTGIPSSESSQVIDLAVDGASIQVDRRVTHRATVPPADAFVALSARSQGRAGPIVIRFSDLLATTQKPDGLFSVRSGRPLRVVVQGSVARLYSASAWGDVELVTVSRALRSEDGRRLKQGRTFRITQTALKPSVKFLGSGVIAPLKAGAAIPIETASLRAVRVTATRVPPSNLGQFFQVNGLGGTTQMKRVGRVVWRERVDLGSELGGGTVRHGLDLSKLVERQGEGLYHIELSFRPQDTNYECPARSFSDLAPEQPDDEQEEEDLTDYAPDEESSWDYAWGAWISGLDPGEQWRQRDNPCHVAYYVPQQEHDIRAARNVLLTNIAVIAKRDPLNRVSVFATDLTTAAPIPDARVEVYDFVHQRMAAGTTGPDGRVTLNAERPPFTVLVRHQKDLGALRLHASDRLTVSHFDVGGAKVSKGLKGFLYGERGVWRPGDTIYLNFLLKDEDRRIPQGHPISFTLRNPSGAVIDAKRITESVGRFYRITTRTGREAPTGAYRAEVSVGGTTFARTLSVEAVVPNRLKIELDFGTDLLVGPRAQLNTTLRSRWLHGAIARGLRSEIDVAFQPMKTRFAKHSDFVFDDPTRKLDSPARRIFDGVLDASGEAKVDTTISTDGTPPGMLRATFTTRVFEASGQSSADRHTLPFSPYPRYIGVKMPKGDRARGMLLTDVEHPVQIVALDPQGQPVDTDVEVRIYKINWRWWWEKGSEDLSQYAGQVSYSTVASGDVAVKAGKGEWKFQIRYPDWGRYLLTVADKNGKHRTGRIFYADWPGWAGRGQKDNPGGPAALTVAADRRQANVGETVSVTFPTPAKGRALVTLENGQRVVASDWVEPQGETTTYEFVAGPEMTPNVFVHVTLLQPYGDRENDHPIRLFGVTPVLVKDPNTRLQPVIEAPVQMRPGTAQTLSVREADGKAMNYTLAIVDEGLLGLTRFRTPNPWSHFHRREGLGVKTWDNFNDVAGGFAGALETLLAIGGGDEEEGDDGTKARRFPPVVMVQGPFALAAGETKEHTLDIPAYLGEVRAMVVAGTDDAYGSADRSIFVRKPLMTYATVPRVLAPQDRLQIPVTVFSTIEGAHTVEVALDVAGNLEAEAPTKSLKLDGPGEAAVSFAVEVGKTPGIARLKVTARSGQAAHTEDIEVDVRYPNPPEVTVVNHTLPPGEQWSPKLTREGLREVSAEVELYRGAAIGLGHRLGELIEYPHGCLEQTVSRAFPQVFLRQLHDLTPLDSSRVQAHVKAAIEKLRQYQSASGGFGVWPNGRSHDWTTNWVGHFLLEARRAGFVVEDDRIERWRAEQERRARRWSETGDARSALTQAYRLYTLALAGKPDLSSMNRLREQPDLDPLTAMRLAVAYALVGDPEAAEKLIPAEIAYVDLDRPDPTFGSAIRDRAMVLEAYVLIGRQTEAEALATTVATALDGRQPLSTQETAFGLLAMTRYLAATADQAPPSVTIRDGKAARSVSLDKPVYRQKLDLAGPAGDGKVVLANTGARPVQVRLVRRGRPDVGESEPAAEGLTVNVRYSTDGVGFVQGEDIEAIVEVSNVSASHLTDLALTQVAPSGWEIRNDRFEGRQDPSGNYTYRDIRDDRVLTYFELGPKASKRFKIRHHAAFVGRFYRPPVRVESMYQPALMAQTASDWVEVVPPGADE